MVSKRTTPLIDGPAFNRNRNKAPPELDRELAGQHVAWEIDGTRVIAHHPDILELVKIIEQLGRTTGDVVFEFLPLDPDAPQFHSWPFDSPTE